MKWELSEAARCSSSPGSKLELLGDSRHPSFRAAISSLAAPRAISGQAGWREVWTYKLLKGAVGQLDACLMAPSATGGGKMVVGWLARGMAPGAVTRAKPELEPNRVTVGCSCIASRSATDVDGGPGWQEGRRSMVFGVRLARLPARRLGRC